MDACGGRGRVVFTELRGALSINRRAGPVIWPSNVPVLAERDHGLDRECHPGLALADRLVLGVVRHVGGAVEQGVYAVAAVRSDDAAVLGLGVLLDDVAKLPDQGSWLDRLDGLVEALAGRLDDAHVVGIRLRLVADIVRLVQVGMVALVEEGDVDIEDVAVNQGALIGDAVADYFVYRGTA